MTYPPTKRSIASVALVALFALAAPASAQNFGDSNSDAERAKEFAKLFGQLQVTSLLLSLDASLAEQRDDVDDQGHMLNPVVTAEPNDIGSSTIGSRPLGGEPESNPSANAHDCINPPADKHARYVAAYVNQAPRIDTMGRRTGGFELLEEKLAPELVERLMPEKLHEGQPGVLLLINRGDGDWVYVLDEAWPEPEMAKRWIDGELGEQVDDDNAVCAVARASEKLLEMSQSSSITHVVRSHELREDIRGLDERIGRVRRDVEQLVPETGLYETEIAPALQQARQHVSAAEQALANDRLETSGDAVRLGREELAQATSRYEAILSLRSAEDDIRAELDRLGEDTELRRIRMLPFGEEIDDSYETCEQLHAHYAEQAQAAESIELPASTRQNVRDCIRKLRARRSETQDTFDLYVIHLPAGTFGLLVLVGFVLLMFRNNKRQKLEYEVSPELSEWAQLVPMFDRRLQRLERKFPGILGADEHAAMSAGLTREHIDTIDRAFAMTHRAGQILDEANRLQHGASLFDLGSLEDCRALLRDDSSELTPSNTADVTPIRRGVRNRETVPHSQLLEATDQLTQKAVSLLEQLEDTHEPGNTTQAW